MAGPGDYVAVGCGDRLSSCPALRHRALRAPGAFQVHPAPGWQETPFAGGERSPAAGFPGKDEKKAGSRVPLAQVRRSSASSGPWP